MTIADDQTRPEAVVVEDGIIVFVGGREGLFSQGAEQPFPKEGFTSYPADPAVPPTRGGGAPASYLWPGHC